ncbi:hypothetical protein V9T40_002921 [Parthenolecanium corni]|uniref:Uncharacterized protein n=1 Tax=Parthenolecanium corni TaxID=536013 RepID=A0AAN9TLM4_9HEMI
MLNSRYKPVPNIPTDIKKYFKHGVPVWEIVIWEYIRHRKDSQQWNGMDSDGMDKLSGTQTKCECVNRSFGRMWMWLWKKKEIRTTRLQVSSSNKSNEQQQQQSALSRTRTPETESRD